MNLLVKSCTGEPSTGGVNLLTSKHTTRSRDGWGEGKRNGRGN